MVDLTQISHEEFSKRFPDRVPSGEEDGDEEDEEESKDLGDNKEEEEDKDGDEDDTKTRIEALYVSTSPATSCCLLYLPQMKWPCATSKKSCSMLLASSSSQSMDLA